MPARKPLGAYRRTTGDWFQHARATATVAFTDNTASQIACGLFNNDQQGRVCHILGVTFQQVINGNAGGIGAWSGEYYSVLGGDLAGGDSAYIPPTQPFFDLDPAPNVVAQAGYVPLTTLIPLRTIPIGSFSYAAVAGTVVQFGASYYPEGGLAAFKAGRGFYVTGFGVGPSTGQVSFDFVMLAD